MQLKPAGPIGIEKGVIGIQSEPWGVSDGQKYLHMVNKMSLYLKMSNSKDGISTQFMHRNLCYLSTSQLAMRDDIADAYIGVCFQALETLECLC